MTSTVNADNGAVSGVSGLKHYSDNSGLLALQTNGVDAVQVNAAQQVNFPNAINAPNTFGFKNRIINGAMMIDQRNAGASVTPADGNYLVDRWFYNGSVGGKFTAQQNAGSVTPPPGFAKYLGFTSTSAYSIGTNDYFMGRQLIEGLNTVDLAWGTASATSVTLSFWVRSSLTGTFGGIIENAASNMCYTFAYTINSANTWEYKTIAVPGPTSGAWATDNSMGIGIWFALGIGSGRTASPGSWGATRGFAPTGQVNVAGTNGATFYITGVQFEKGSQATAFDFRSYQQELALCQRYFEQTSGAFYNNGNASYMLGINFAVDKRASPTITRLSSFWSGAEAAPTVNAGYPATRNFFISGSTTTFLGGNFSASAEL